MGVSPSAFRKWLKGEAEPSRERLVALAHAASVGVAWLAEGEGPAPTFEPPGDDRRRSSGHETPTETDWGQFVLLPHRPEAAAAGSITPPSPSGSEWMALRHDWLRATCGIEPSEVLLEMATGDSMTPTIRDGNLLLVDTTERHFATSVFTCWRLTDSDWSSGYNASTTGALPISDNPRINLIVSTRRQLTTWWSLAEWFGPAAQSKTVRSKIDSAQALISWSMTTFPAIHRRTFSITRPTAADRKQTIIFGNVACYLEYAPTSATFEQGAKRHHCCVVPQNQGDRRDGGVLWQDGIRAAMGACWLARLSQLDLSFTDLATIGCRSPGGVPVEPARTG